MQESEIVTPHGRYKNITQNIPQKTAIIAT